MASLRNVKTFCPKGSSWWSYYTPTAVTWATSGCSIKIGFGMPPHSSIMILFFNPPHIHIHSLEYSDNNQYMMRRYWIIIIAISFNFFQLWFYNSIFGIRIKWVMTTKSFWGGALFFIFGFILSNVIYMIFYKVLSFPCFLSLWKKILKLKFIFSFDL